MAAVVATFDHKYVAPPLAVNVPNAPSLAERASRRIATIADVYDALMSQRSYKRPFTHAESRHTILAGSGSQFDPAVVEAMLAVADKTASLIISGAGAVIEPMAATPLDPRSRALAETRPQGAGA